MITPVPGSVGGTGESAGAAERQAAAPKIKSATKKVGAN